MVRSRILCLVGVALGHAILFLPARAEEGFGGAPPPVAVAARQYVNVGRKLPLLGMDQVEKELKITAEQREAIAASQKKLREDIGGLQPPSVLDEMSDEERKERVAKLEEKRKELVGAAEKEIEGILKPEQSKRLSEIALQLGGVEALKEKGYAETLKLSKEQLGKIDEAVTWGRDEERKLFQARRNGGGKGPDREAVAKTLEKQKQIRKEVETKVLGTMKDSQRKEYQRMKGVPFKLVPMAGAARVGSGGMAAGPKPKEGPGFGGGAAPPEKAEPKEDL